MNTKYRLTLMNFLQFAVWGAYLTSMGTYLAGAGFGSIIGWFYAIQGVVSIFMPGIMGIVADRWIPAQRLLGLCHLMAGALMAAAGVYGLSSDANISVLFSLYACSVAFYMPTLALSNSVAFNALTKAGLDTVKDFPPIRVFGTVGFICTMWVVDGGFITIFNYFFVIISLNSTLFDADSLTSSIDIFFNSILSSMSNGWSADLLKGILLGGMQHKSLQFVLSGVISIVLAIYAQTLPACPVKAKVSGGEQQSLVQALGLDAFKLFKDYRMAVFFIFSMLLGVSLQITNGYANPYITSFQGIAEFGDTFGAQHANILISLSQISETCCILLIPFFLKRFGIKRVMLIAMIAWVFRFGLFGTGNPGPGVWMFVLSCIVYGVAFDFFNISGALYVDQNTNESIRSSAQGLFMIMTNGLGATAGTLAAQEIVNYFVYNQPEAMQLEGWRTCWFIFAAYALVVGIAFFFLFKNPAKKEA